ncbi:pilus assembly PilX N-terminal domain-containing protein, partial [bacterium]|nr:pilus assembly PilX N-terminal domain-containing protein [bacterium]
MRKNKIKDKEIKFIFSNQKGMALLTTLIFVFILVTFAVALLTMTSNDIKMSTLQRDSTKAFYIAEAGIQDAIGRLVNGTVSDTGNETVTDWNVDNSYS